MGTGAGNCVGGPANVGAPQGANAAAPHATNGGTCVTALFAACAAPTGTPSRGMLRRQCRSAARRECGGSAQHEQIQAPIHPTTTSIPTCLSFSATLLHSTPMLPRKTPPARRQGHDTEAAATIRTHPLPHAADKPCYLYTNDAALKGHADYKAAKAGNATAAGPLLRDLAADFIKDTARQFGDSVLFVAPMHAKRAVTTPSRRCSLPRWPSHPAGARTRASCSASASSTPAPT